MPPLLVARRLLPLAGIAAFALAALSLADMFLPRPYDGVVLESDAPGQLMVADVVAGSGAARAGIERGDRIVGIGREVLRSEAHAAALLRRHRIGESVPYLVETPRGRRELPVQLGPRRIGSLAYLGAALLGFAFFAVGTFVLAPPAASCSRRGSSTCCRSSSCVFLVCRLRPASYSAVDVFVLQTGTAGAAAAAGHLPALLPRLPAAALGGRRRRRCRSSAAAGAAPRLARRALPAAAASVFVYNLDLVHAARRVDPHQRRAARQLVAARRLHAAGPGRARRQRRGRLARANERRGAWLVFLGTLFGLVPFLVFTVGFPSVRHTERYLFYGVAPLGLVPLTFAYAIVRFQLLDIRVILRKSLFYTATTAVVTALYAGGIAAFNWIFQGSAAARSAWFPVVFALAIVLGLDPLRRRLQGPVDRFFYGELPRLQRAMVELGEALSADRDPGALVHELVEGLPRQLGLHFAALYLAEEGELRRAAGPASLPRDARRPARAAPAAARRRRAGAARAARRPRRRRTPRRCCTRSPRSGVEVAAELASPRRRLGLVLLSARASQLSWERAELELLRGLLAQAAIALETGLLLAERTRQAELEREMEIAAGIQASLLPASLRFAPGWQVAVRCRPARHVGGDFFCELAQHNGAGGSGNGSGGAGLRRRRRQVGAGGADDDGGARGAALAGAHRPRARGAAGARQPPPLPASPAQLRRPRLPAPRRRTDRLRYALAGQPGLLLRRADGRVEELPLCRHRVPLGALAEGDYPLAEVTVADGELVLGYSDGVLDARSPAGDFFGAERLAAALADAPARARRGGRLDPRPARRLHPRRRPLRRRDAGGRRPPPGGSSMRKTTRHHPRRHRRCSAPPASPPGRRCATRDEPEWTTSSPAALAEMRLGIDAQRKYYGLEAQRHFEKALELDPHFAMAARMLMRTDVPKERREQLRAQLAADRPHAAQRARGLPHRLRTGAGGRARRRRSSTQIVDGYLRQHPRDPYALAVAGRPLLGGAALGRSRARLPEAARASTPTGSTRRTRWATCRWRRGASPRPRTASAPTATWRPTRPTRTTRSASCWCSLGRFDEAQRELEAALAIRPDFCNSYLNLMEAARLTGHPERLPPLLASAGEERLRRRTDRQRPLLDPHVGALPGARLEAAGGHLPRAVRAAGAQPRSGAPPPRGGARRRPARWRARSRRSRPSRRATT